jgi:hypothetical protein
LDPIAADGSIVVEIKYARQSHNVTWKIDGNDEVVPTKYGATPTHAVPTKATDLYVYTFAGWKNGSTTYAPDEALPTM